MTNINIEWNSSTQDRVSGRARLEFKQIKPGANLEGFLAERKLSKLNRLGKMIETDPLARVREQYNALRQQLQNLGLEELMQELPDSVHDKITFEVEAEHLPHVLKRAVCYKLVDLSEEQIEALCQDKEAMAAA